MSFWKHTNGKVFNQLEAFMECKFPELIYLHSYMELFHKDCSLAVIINCNYPVEPQQSEE